MNFAPIDKALDRLKSYDENIFTQSYDVRQLTFAGEGDHGMLVTPDGRNLTLTKDSVTSLSRFVKIPAGYVRTASATLVNKSLKEFGEQLENSTANAIIHKNPIDNRLTLRGVIEEGKKFRPNSCMLENAKRIFGDDIAVEHAPWTTGEHPAFFRTRLVWPNTAVSINNDPVMLGLDLLGSDIEHIQEQINIMLYRQVCTNGMIASYGQRPYFHFDHKKSSIFDYEPVIASVSDRIGDDAPEIFERVRTSHGSTLTKQEAHDALLDLESRKKLPKSFVVKTMTSIEENPTFSREWDLVNAITAQARNYKDMARLKYEFVGGNLLGLNFKASTKQELGLESESN